MALVNLSIVLTHRSENTYRDRNIRAVMEHIGKLPDKEIILVEQDQRKRLALADTFPNVEHVFAFNPGLFNRSWGFNIGALRARGSTLLLMDGDLIIEHWAMAEALDACRSGVTAVNPYDLVVDLSAADSGKVAASEPVVDRMRLQGSRREQTGEYPPFCGGAYFIDAGFYREIGGQDERFCNWGGEDNAMTTKVLRLAPRAISISGSTAYHLYHPHPANGRYGHPQYEMNMALLSSYVSKSDDELLTFNSGPIGNPDQYRK